MTLDVLVIDADAGAARELEAARPAWTVRTAAGAADADAEPDAAVAPLGDGSGLESLRAVADRWPRALRIATAAAAGPDLVFRAVGVAHRLITGPPSGTRLAASIERAAAVARLVDDERLVDMAGRMGALPALPSIYAELASALQSPDSSLRDIGEIITRDPAMTAQILRLVNSAHFGLLRRVSDVGMAVNYLGVMTVSSLALSVHLFEGLDREAVGRTRIARLWNRSLAAGTFARIVADIEGLPTGDADDALTAGLLHGCGRVLLATNMTAPYARVVSRAASEGEALDRVEARELGFTHCEVGAVLLARWGLSSSVVESVAFQLSPADVSHEEFLPLTAVHVARALSAGPPHEWGDAPDGIDLEYLERIGAAGRLPAWLDACREVVDLEGAPA